MRVLVLAYTEILGVTIGGDRRQPVEVATGYRPSEDRLQASAVNQEP